MDGEWPYDVIGSLPCTKIGLKYLSRPKLPREVTPFSGGDAEYHHIIKPRDAVMNDGGRRGIAMVVWCDGVMVRCAFEGVSLRADWTNPVHLSRIYSERLIVAALSRS
jgi:hypothetical protein